MKLHRRLFLILGSAALVAIVGYQQFIRLSPEQQAIKAQVLAGRVRWEEVRIR